MVSSSDVANLLKDNIQDVVGNFLDQLSKEGYGSEPCSYKDLLVKIEEKKLTYPYDGINASKIEELLNMGLIKVENNQFRVTPLGKIYIKG